MASDIKLVECGVHELIWRSRLADSSWKAECFKYGRRLCCSSKDWLADHDQA